MVVVSLVTMSTSPPATQDTVTDDDSDSVDVVGAPAGPWDSTGAGEVGDGADGVGR
jgi:hypothetical protein